MDDLYTLEDLSRRLGNIPISTLKHRIHQLGIPAAARGSRNKLLFDPALIEVLEAADRLIREGHGIHSVRRVLKLNDAPASPTQDADDDGYGPEASDDLPVVLASVVPVPPPAADGDALDRLSRSLENVLEQLAVKDRQVESLQTELRRAQEAAATFQQKTFYLQGELQRLQGELRDARRTAVPDVAPGINLGLGPLPWKRLWRKET